MLGFNMKTGKRGKKKKRGKNIRWQICEKPGKNKGLKNNVSGKSGKKE